jgi:hypothetical protein
MLAVAQVNWRARLLMIFQVLTNATRSPQEPPSSSHNFEQQDPAVPVAFDDEQSFRDWCERELATPSPWQVNLRGLKSLLRAEIQWTLFAHAQRDRPGRWVWA